MSDMIRRLSAAWLFCALLSGCGGGGGGGSSLPKTQPVTPTTTGKQNVKVSIAIPAAKTLTAAAKRFPKYISVNTQSAAISVNGAAPVIANLAAGSSNCVPATGGGRTCTVSVSAPVGLDTFSETLYASTDGSGPFLSQNTTTVTITAGAANTVTMTLAGSVASIAVTVGNSSPVESGLPTTIPVTVNFYDPSGATIIGDYPFADAVILKDSDASGATKLSATELDTPADANGLTVTYNGVLTSPFVISASAVYVTGTVISATLTPVAAGSTPFVDWPTYGYDSQRSGFNPYSTAITPASVPSMHLGWQVETQGSQTQPIVATNVAGHQAIVVVGDYNFVEAYDALTGGAVWKTSLPKQDVQACGTAGVAGTVVYDKALNSIFAVAGNGGGAPNHIVLYQLNAATGTLQNKTDVTPTLLPGEANDSHAGLAFVNGVIYVGTGSDCEGDPTIAYPSWRGRVVSVDPSSMAILNTFFTTWQQGAAPGNYGGGGVWAWGGVSADPSGNIYVATGNAETNLTTGTGKITAPFTPTDDEQAGYAEQLVKLSGDLSTVEGSNYPGFNFTIGYDDLDYTGSPVVFQPPLASGCGLLTATQGKGGTLVINDASTMNVVNSFALSVPSGRAYYMGNPAYSPSTGFVYAAISSSGNGSSMLPPGLAAIGSCGQTIAWHAQFGPDSTAYAQGDNPRSAPTVTAGGVVFLGTPCTPIAGGGCGAPSGTANGAVWAVDASAPTVIGGKPILQTTASIRVPPTVDGKWMYVYDTGGNLYGLTIDPTVKAVAAKLGHRVPPAFRYKKNG